MGSQLLLTKLHAPQPRPHRVTRPRLLSALDSGLEAGHRLTLASAPAGFGKTTLLSEWAQAAGRAVAWLTLGEEDGDPALFARYLVAAFQHAGVLGAAPGGPPPPMAEAAPLALMTPLVNALAADGSRVVLVLDDYHAVASADVHQMLGFLLEHQPPGLHVVISTREDPPLPLAQLRARGWITELRQHDLRFTVEEAAAFLNETMGLGLSADAVAALEARTEGWIAGLQLAALAVQRSPADAQRFIETFTGHNRYVMDYLIAEVLNRQPEAVRAFLRQTALLRQLSASLCDAVTGQAGSQAMLEQLDAANLFVVPLDDRREWYRYHRLFAEMMQLDLSPEEQARIHQRATEWYRANDLPGEAVHHALALGRRAGDLTEAASIIRAAGEDMLHSGSLATLQNWLSALPGELVEADSQLALLQGWVLALSGQMAQAVRAAAALPAASGEADTLRAFVALLGEQDEPGALELAEAALETLPPGEAHWRVVARWVRAEVLEHTAHIDRAIEAFRATRQAGLSLEGDIFTATAENSLALALNNAGRRQDALIVCQEALQRAGRAASPSTAILHIRQALLHYEGGDLAEAQSSYEAGMEQVGGPGMEGYQVMFRALAAPILHAGGAFDDALAALLTAEPYAERARLVDPAWIAGMAAHLRLLHGDVASAVQWADSYGASASDGPTYRTIEQDVTLARVLLAAGRLDAAGQWLDELAAFAEARGLVRWQISTRILQALAAARRGEQAPGEQALAQAVEFAAPGGYIRAFLDEDPQVIALLAAGDVRMRAPLFVDRVLAAAGLPAPPSLTHPSLVEPLTEREVEVLTLIAQGLTNQEIGERLFIALGTVKTHINNLYGKLEVRSRTEAIAKARALHLLS